MSDGNPFEQFGGMFGDVFKMLGQQGPNAWLDTARALALSVARGDDADPNPSPVARQRLEQLAPVISLHVNALLGISATPHVVAVTRSELTTAALDDWAPLLAPYANTPTGDLGNFVDPAMGGLLAQMSSALGPLFMGFQLGSVAGHYSEDAWSLAALPLPRTSEIRRVHVDNVVRFAEEWSLDVDHALTFAAAQELVAAALLTSDGTTTALAALLFDAVRDAHRNQGDLMSKLTAMLDPNDLQRALANPEELLEGLTLNEETPATAALEAAVMALVSVIDYAAELVTHATLGPTPLLDEAQRRRRRTEARGADGAAALMGVNLRGARVNVADEFVERIVATSGTDVLATFFRVDGLPSSPELTDPTAWLERVANSPFA